MRRRFDVWWLVLALFGVSAASVAGAPAENRHRIIIETDAGGDPDDEQSLVRFLLYVNEWDVEGIIANRPRARDGENLNPERTGPGIVRRLIEAYRECHPHLIRHDPRYPTADELLARTVPGGNESTDGVRLLLEAVDRADPRPVWYSDWGTDHGAATNNLRRTLDQVLRERGPDAYAVFKQRLRLASADAFGEHTHGLAPPFPLWVDTWRPALDGRRWYHRFSALTATAGGFDVVRDVLTGHGPLGALYPTNTTHPQKEGDTASFLYLVPTGMNDPRQPLWGSWGGRLGLQPNAAGRPYYWANPVDAWSGATNRDNTLARWCADLQNDFRARLDWCVRDFAGANHPPRPIVNGRGEPEPLRVAVAPGDVVALDAAASQDPDGDALEFEWWIYREAGTYFEPVAVTDAGAARARVRVPEDAAGTEIHVMLTLRDRGAPPLTRYRRMVLQVTGVRRDN